MTDQLHLQSGSLPGLSGIHSDVANALGQVTGSAPESLDIEASHGQIASAVYGALGTTLPSRLGTLQATSTSAQTISDLLIKADQMYEQGDRQSAEKLRAAAEALEEAEGGNRAGGASAGGAGAATAGGGDQAGQMAGQVGQQVGQIAGSMAQAVQGLAQGLTQLPQQIMQGVQGIAQSATEAGGAADAKPDDPTAEDREKSGRDESEEDKEKDGKDERPSTQRDGAQSGTSSAEQGRAPEPTPPVERPQPAQTRPQ